MPIQPDALGLMPHTTGFAWTAEADAELRRLLEKRYTASMIAGKLSTAFAVHLSRSAVLGRAHRKGLVKREVPIAALKSKAPAPPKPKRRTGFQPTMRERISFPVAAVAPEPPIDLTPTMRFFDRRSGDCAWISGEPSFDAMCCGRPVIEGRPYCLAHCRMAYQRPGDYRRASLPPEERAAPPAIDVAA
jgi:GcrA cell cycle regulator